MEASARLKRADLRVGDFEATIDSCGPTDMLFCDPPYRPAARELLYQHYLGSQFAYADHQRLASALRRATERGVRWLLTTSSHPEIVALFEGCLIYPLLRGRCQTAATCGEVVVANWDEGN